MSPPGGVLAPVLFLITTGFGGSPQQADWLDSVLGSTRQGVFSADFESPNNTRVEVDDGDNLTLNCAVFLKQEKTVSWLRHPLIPNAVPDLLTVGSNTYTGDPRISADFVYPNNWRLNITMVGGRDAGLYVCQLSTHPPKALHTTLAVRDAVMEIEAEPGDLMAGRPPDKYYNPGSHIRLRCVVRRALIKNATVQDITHVTWRKGGEVLDLHSEERVSMGVQVEGERLVSTLLINNAVEADAGLYSCSLGVFSHRLFPKARANVHVIQGDRLAVQGGARQQSQHWHKVLLKTWVIGVLMACLQ